MVYIIIIQHVDKISPFQSLEQTSLKELLSTKPSNLGTQCPSKYANLKILRPDRDRAAKTETKKRERDDRHGRTNEGRGPPPLEPRPHHARPLHCRSDYFRTSLRHDADVQQHDACCYAVPRSTAVPLRSPDVPRESGLRAVQHERVGTW